LAKDLGASFIREGGDAYVFVWNISNFAKQVHEGRNPFHTDRIFCPIGSSLLYHTYSPIYGAAGLLCNNEILVLNLTLYLSFVLSAVGACCLCYRHVPNLLLSLMAGLVFAFCPYKLVHLAGHYNLMLTATIPYFFLCLESALPWDPVTGRIKRGRPVSLAACLLLLLITFFSDYYYALFLLITTALYTAYFLFRIYNFNPFRIRNAGIILCVLAFSTLVGKILMSTRFDTKGAFSLCADLAGFVVPSPYNRFVNNHKWYKFHCNVLGMNPTETTVFVGYTLLVLVAGYFLFRCWRKESPDRKIFLFLTAAFAALSMPVVRVAGQTVGILPTIILHYIPFANSFRAPGRYTIMLMLFLPILGSVFLDRIVFPRAHRIVRTVLPVLLISALAVEYIQRPYSRATRIGVPAVYDFLSEEEDGSLLPIPFGVRDGLRMAGKERSRHMFYQTVHNKKIFGGMLARVSDSVFDFYQSDPVVSSLLRVQTNRTAEISVPTAQQVTEFANRCNLRYVVVEPGYIDSRIHQLVEEVFAGLIEERNVIDSHLLLILAKQAGSDLEFSLKEP